MSDDHGGSRPSMDTEAVSGDEAEKEEAGGFEEISFDATTLNPSCLVPPTIPNTLGADDIDKVIAALTNVPDVNVPDGLISGSGEQREHRRSHSGERRDHGDYRHSHDRHSHDRDYGDHYDRGRGYRGRGRGRGRGGFRGRGGYRGGGEYVPRGRAKPYIAKGRNIFPEDEERGRGRGRARVNNLYKRFMQQHRPGQGQGDEMDQLEYGRRSRSRSRSRSGDRDRSRRRRKSSSSSSSRSSSSSSDSTSPKKKKKKKEKKHKKKKKSSAKKKKKDSSSDSESEKEETGSDWRVELLKKMKDIKSLPPDQLEVEFKKAMAEKKRKEEEEKCILEIKNRQKQARRVKKESERAMKRAAKKEKKKKAEEEEVVENDGFYGGINMEADIKRMEEEEAMLKRERLEMQFKSSFAEVPFVPEGENAEENMDTGEAGGENAAETDLNDRPHPGAEAELDPYTKAMREAQRAKEIKSEAGTEEVSWPAGAIEEAEYDQETREQVEAAQEEMENNVMDDKAKNVVSTSKMFSKIRNRIKTKPLKIQLKTNKLSTEEDEGIGLNPVPDTGDHTPLEPLSDDDNIGNYYDGYNEGVGDEYDVKDQPVFNDDEEERRVARYRERNKKRRERALEAGELEDGEHSPSPEPERPHHRRRRKRRHERREDMEEGEIGEERSRRSRHREDYDQSGPPGSFPGPSSAHMLGVPPPRLPYIDTTRPPPMPVPVAHPPPVHHQPPLARPPQSPFYPPASVVPAYPAPAYNSGPQNEMYNAYSSPTRGYHGLGQVKPERPNYFESLPAQPRPSDQMEAVDSEDDDDSVDITKVSPIMKYISNKLVEHKYHLEMDGPFRYRSDIPGLSKHLFVAYKFALMLEGAGYDNSKMYMSAMFPQGMADTKAKLIKMLTTGELDPRIKGSRLIKMCQRCVKCFIAYYTGKSDDIGSSEGECSSLDEEEAEAGGKKAVKVKTVNTSLTAILNRIKDDGDNDSGPETPAPAPVDPLSSVLNTADKARFSVEENPWSTMEMDMRSNNLKTFTALQAHFTKQLVGKGMDTREARDQAGDSIMCFVVANFSDMMLRDMISRYKKVILPEQSELEVTRYGQERTLYDQIVDKLMKHHTEFPLSILQEVRREDDWKAAMMKKMRNFVERMLKFYMRGLGKLQEGKDNAGPGPNDPSELQFNYLPEGLRDDEAPAAKVNSFKRQESNFFNMEQAAAANRSFSSYKRTSTDDSNLEPVSPDSKGSLSRARYLFGTLYVDTLLFQGSSYVYEIGVHMSDSSSIEVYIVPTKLTKQHSVLEMLGFSFTPDEKKYIYRKPGTSGFSRTYSEEHGLDKIVQFLKEKRFESRGDSENSGLVLTTQTIEDLATWIKFSMFHQKDWQLRDVVAGYGCLDLFVEESKGDFTYVGPKLNRDSEANQTFFTWEYCRNGFSSQEMSASKADALLRMTERLLDDTPTYDNFIKTHCFTMDSRQYQEISRRFEIIKDMYQLEYHIATSLNVRAEKRRLFTEGVFCPRSTAELGDRPGLVAARMIRILAEMGYSRHSLNQLVMETRERGGVLGLPGLGSVMARMRSNEDRERCETQLGVVTKYIEEYFLRR